MSVYHCHALPTGLSIILGEAKSLIVMAVAVSESGWKKKVFYSTKDKWWNFPLNHFLLLLNPKGWEEALQFIIPAVTGTIIFQGVAIRPAFQQLIKPAININSRQEFVTVLLIQSSGWLLWLALWYPFQGFFWVRLRWLEITMGWCDELQPCAAGPSVPCMGCHQHRFCLNVKLRAPWPRLLWFQLCLVTSKTTQGTSFSSIKFSKLNA